jgi:hypothetical protein
MLDLGCTGHRQKALLKKTEIALSTGSFLELRSSHLSWQPGTTGTESIELDYVHCESNTSKVGAAAARTFHVLLSVGQPRPERTR